MRPFLMAALMVIAFSGAHAQDSASDVAAASPVHRDVLEAAHAKARQQLGKRVLFDIKQFRVMGDWAFLHAGMQDPNGQPVSYAGTRFEDADRHGQKSSNYDALLHRAGGRWTVRVDSVGATDVPWTNWSRDYGAPAKIFDSTAR